MDLPKGETKMKTHEFLITFILIFVCLKLVGGERPVPAPAPACVCADGGQP